VEPEGAIRDEGTVDRSWRHAILPSVTDRPLVSIVTPTLNQGRFIEATIRSIRAQTYDHFEHIVVDGGSTDDTLDILERHRPAYDLRWISEPDHGMYDAVNKGLRLAKGEIVCYLNSDDLYVPWTLETVVRRLAAEPNAMLVYGDVINVDDETRDEHFRLMPAFDLERLRSVWPLPQPAVFWRRAVSDQLQGFDASLQYVGDWDFFIRAGERFPVRKVDEFLAIERRHGASKTIGQADPMQAETVRMLGRTPAGSPGGRLRQRIRRIEALAARRLVWVRFLERVLRGRKRGAWGQLLRATDVHVSVWRLAIGFIPGTPRRWKADAVSTDVDWLEGTMGSGGRT
jgi:glycosyltransferase involved in cell wall biosynthesis